MTLLAILLTLVFTYAIASDAVFLAISRLLRGTEEGKGRELRLFVLTRGAGPALLSVVTYLLFLFFPQRPRGFYVVAILLVFAVPCLVARSEWTRLAAAYRAAGRALRGGLRLVPTSPPLAAAAALAVAAVWFGVAFPIVEHDALAATIEARIMTRDVSMANYLAVKEPDPQTGYYMENFRTPFLQLLFVWFSLASGPQQMDLLARTVSPAFGLACLALLAAALGRRGDVRDVAWAVLLLGSTPLFFYNCYNNGNDTASLYLAFVALIFIADLLERRGARLALVTGLFVGLALYCHMINVLALGSAALVFLAVRPWQVRRKIALCALVVVTAGICGAQFHYVTHPQLLQLVARSFDPSFLKEAAALLRPPPPRESPAEPAAQAVGAVEAAPPAVEAAPPSSAAAVAAKPRPRAKPRKKTTSEKHAAILEIRGQGATPWSHLIFGRLQMFTGVEYFGVVFYLFGVAVFLWLRRPKEALEKMLLVAAFFVCVFVLSGVRNLAWSNPRYIGSLLVVAAYFGAPLLGTVEAFLRRRLALRLRSFATWALVLFLVFPTVLVTSIRGAKAGITNPGNFYKDFRSLKWLSFALEEPGAAVRSFYHDYFGIRQTFAQAFADDTTKLRHAHDYFAGVFYVNEKTASDAKIFLFRDTRFFYYAERYGVVWYSPQIDRRMYFTPRTAERFYAYLCGEAFTHVLTDDYSELQRGFYFTMMGEILAVPGRSEQVYEYGTARVYRLRCPQGRER